MVDECSEFFLTIPRAPPRDDADKNPEKDRLEGDNKDDNFTGLPDDSDEVGGPLGPPFFIIIILVDRDGDDATFSDTDFFLYCHRVRDLVDRGVDGEGDNKL